jgi:hypothetical protein
MTPAAPRPAMELVSAQMVIEALQARQPSSSNSEYLAQLAARLNAALRPALEVALAKAVLAEAEWWYPYAHWFENKKPAPACDERIESLRSQAGAK